MHTINAAQVPVGRFLAMGQGESEGLGEGGTVYVLGLEDDRFGFLHTDEGLNLHQFGEVVIHIQQSHMHNVL